MTVKRREIRPIVRDERVILSADPCHQLPVLVPSKTEKVHMLADMPGVMRQGNQRRVKALIKQELHQLARRCALTRRGRRLAHERLLGRPLRGNALTYNGANSTFSRVSAG